MSRGVNGAERWRLAGAVGSGLLLAAAFPPWNADAAAWVALAPLIAVMRVSTPRQAFRAGWLAGFVFWTINLAWLRRLGDFDAPRLAAWSGWWALAAACAVYLGLFATAGAQLWRGATRDAGVAANLGRMAALALLWAGFEYLRATLFTGFAWNGLGVSQFRNLPLIQLAEWGGVYLVSAVIVFVNAGLAFTGVRVAAGLRGRAGLRWNPELLAVLGVLALCFTVGVRRLQALQAGFAGTPLRVALIQGNVSQDAKWSATSAAEIQQHLVGLTERAGVLEPGLTVWPETALPWVVGPGQVEAPVLAELAVAVGPLLIGAIEADDAQPARYYNSAMLLDGAGRLAGTYRKRHLVPFGEYIPLAGTFPALEGLSPLGYSCTAGATGTVFRVGAPEIPFASLICFEDAIAPIARQAVRNGARLLVNQTNDGWFEGTSAAVQHLAQCVFRCVENRVPAVRCANMGVSGSIARTGALDATTAAALTRADRENTLFRTEVVDVPVGGGLTFYARWGDWPFGIPCAGLGVLALASAWPGWGRGRGAFRQK